MNLTWGIFGFAGFSLLGFFIYFLVRTGKKLQQGKEALLRESALISDMAKKNEYIKDVDKIVHDKDILKKRARSYFNNGDVGSIVRILERAHKYTKTNKT